MKKTQILDQNWTLQCAETGNRYAVPGMPMQVHEVLHAAGVISDTYMGGQTKDCRWVGRQTWVYETVFTVEEELVRLTFAGLDTICEIQINGRPAGRAKDCYIPLELDISALCRKGENLLTVIFPPLEKEIERIKDRYYEMLEENEELLPCRFIRKTHHNFSNYLGNDPDFWQIGIFKEVTLTQMPEGICVKKPEISYVLSERMDSADIQVKLNVESSGREVPGGKVLNKVQLFFEDQLLEEQQGTDIQTVCFHIEKPRLWWPRGYGNADMYEIRAMVCSADNGLIDSTAVRIGLRNIRMPQLLHFVVNGRPIRLWGANLTPDEGHTLVEDPARIVRLMELAKDAHCNCIRIWGEGVPMSDAVYEYADEHGILLWQEFFLGNAWYPYVQEFKDKVLQEVRSMVTRLKDHPSILLWCGGNECFLCRDYSHPEKSYSAGILLEYDIRRVCSELDPDRYYHINSPWFGDYANDPGEGDTHSYTNSWYVPGAEYPGFVAENLRVSFPRLESLKKYMNMESLPECRPYKNGTLPWPEEYERITSAQSYMKIASIENFYDAQTPEEMIYRFGAAAGMYLKDSIERYRRGKKSQEPFEKRRTFGHLVWKLNTTFPHLYSAMIDFYLEPKMNYFYVKRAYQPLKLSIEVGDRPVVWVINDTAHGVKGRLRAEAFEIETNRWIRECETYIQAEPDESIPALSLDRFGQMTRNTVLLSCLFDEAGNEIACAHQFLDVERHIRFPDGDFSMLWNEKGEICFKSDTFIRSMELSAEGIQGGHWDFSDNYFDLFPGREKRVTVKTTDGKGEITAKGFYGSIKKQLHYDAHNIS